MARKGNPISESPSDLFKGNGGFVHSCKTLLYNVSVLTLCEAFLLRSGGTRFLVKNSRESTIHSVFASGIYLRVGSPISLGNGHSPQVLMRQDLSLLKRCLKIERLWAKYTRQTNSWPESVICCLSFNGSEITLSPFSKEEI